jgi:hypothetical protein
MKRIKTGGGRFDPKSEPLYFIAGGLNLGTPWTVTRNVLYALNEAPIHRGDMLELTAAYEPRVNIMLDSGIFAITQEYARHKGVHMNDALTLSPDDIDGFGELWDNYLRIVPQFESRLWGYVELDQGGAAAKKATRAKLEAAGLRPIPVYHPLLDGWDYFDELCQRYDRVCTANVVHAEYEVRRSILRTLWERHAKYPDVWLHVLGITPMPLLLAYPSNSCDSSSWIVPVRYGTPHAYTWTQAWPPTMGEDWLYDRQVEQNEAAGFHRAAMVSAIEAEAVRRTWAHHTSEMLCERWPA